MTYAHNPWSQTQSWQFDKKNLEGDLFPESHKKQKSLTWWVSGKSSSRTRLVQPAGVSTTAAVAAADQQSSSKHGFLCLNVISIMIPWLNYPQRQVCCHISLTPQPTSCPDHKRMLDAALWCHVANGRRSEIKKKLKWWVFTSELKVEKLDHGW